MKKLLITGASGLVGRALLKHCSSRFDVVGTFQNRDHKPDNATLRPLNLSNPSEMEDYLDELRPSIVIHTAGLTDIQYCQEHQQETENINYHATAQLAAFCTQRGTRLVYLSSDMVFDGEKGDYKEDDQLNPKNHYGRSKSAAEEAIKGICENYVIARINLVYGHGEAVKKTFTERILIANWSNKSYPIYKGQVRSPISLDVTARAIRELAEGNFSGIYHLGGKESIDRWDFALKLLSYLKIDNSIVEESEIPNEYKEIYPMNTSFDITKVNTELKTDMLTIEEGIKLEYGRYMD